MFRGIFLLMSPDLHKCVIRVVGVALSGQAGSPVVVFNNPENREYLTLAVDPFDAEILIRDFSGEADDSAVSWLGDLLSSSPPNRADVVFSEDGRPEICLSFGRLIPGRRQRLSLGEGLALVRRLSLELYAPEKLFRDSAVEINYLTETRAFSNQFLYLTPPQYAPNIPLE